MNIFTLWANGSINAEAIAWTLLITAPFAVIFFSWFLISAYIHRLQMLRWFYLAVDYELDYHAPKGSLQTYFDLTDAEKARRHKPVPPLLSLGGYAGEITGTCQDSFQVEMTIIKEGSLRDHPQKKAVRSLSDAALNRLPESWFFNAESKGSNPYTVIRIGASGMPPWLIEKKTRWQRFSEHLGIMKDIKTGDPAFDELCLIQGENENEVRSHLNEHRKTAIVQAFENLKPPGGSILIDMHGVFYYRRGILWREKELNATFDQLLKLAKSFAYFK